jgi:cytochrome c556
MVKVDCAYSIAPGMNLRRIFLGGAATVLACLPAIAQQARPETYIKWRQSVYQVMVWNAARIRDNLEGTQYNREEVVKAARLLSDLANGGIGGLFPAGTEKGRGWRDTTARPELFRDTARIRELAGNFAREADELLKVATNADADAVKIQYGRVTQSCKACHDEFKVKE